MSAQGFFDPYKSPYDDVSFLGDGNSWNKTGADDANYGISWSSPNFFGNKVSDFFGFSNYQGKYDLAMARLNEAYERASVNSARAWDEYMSSTQYQRLVKDLEAAGLNPWIALQSGIGGTSNTQTASQGGSAKASASSNKSNLSGVAMLLLATARLIAAL